MAAISADACDHQVGGFVLKKRGIWLFCLCFFLLLSACGTERKIDCNALAHDLYTQLDFDDELSEIEPDMAKKIYGIQDAVSMIVYLSSGATAEEIAVFELPDHESAVHAQEQMEKRIASQKASFERYIPDEVERLNHAIVRCSGCYTVLCVSRDAKATEILQKYLE